jgi:hypothetical protein
LATVEVDLVFFLLVTIIALFSLPFILGWTFWKGYKNPEFWLRLKRQDWVYALVLNAVGKIVTVVIPLSRISETGAFTMFKNRKYFWPLENNAKGKPGGRAIDNEGHPVPNNPKDEKEGQLIFPYKKKTAAFFRYGDPFAQLWAPGNTIFSITDPGMVDAIEKNKALAMMMNADALTLLMRISLVLGVISIIIIAGLGYVFYGQTTAVNHLACILQAGNNATLAGMCH